MGHQLNDFGHRLISEKHSFYTLHSASILCLRPVFCVILLLLMAPGVYNDNNEEEKGEERNINHPWERLRFQNFLMVVLLLSSDVDDVSQ